MKTNNKSLVVNIAKLKLWDKNPRKATPGDMERLKRQIKKHGIYKPLVCIKDGENYEVIGGNMRLKALQELGYKEVWISIVEPKSEVEKIEISLSDNDRAGYYLEDELNALILDNPDISLIDYSIDIEMPSINLENLFSKNSFLVNEKLNKRNIKEGEGDYLIIFFNTKELCSKFKEGLNLDKDKRVFKFEILQEKFKIKL